METTSTQTEIALKDEWANHHLPHLFSHIHGYKKARLSLIEMKRAAARGQRKRLLPKALKVSVVLEERRLEGEDTDHC